MSHVHGAVQAVIDRLRKAANELDEDVVVEIDGKEGSGKSTMAIRLALVLEPGWGTEIPLRQRCFYHPKPYLRHSESAGSQACLVADEGMEFVYKREGMTRGVRDFNKEMARNRYRNQYHVLCIPDRNKADGDWENWRAQFRIETLKRPKGEAFFYVPGGKGHWKRLFKFPFASLEGTQLWADYLQHKEDKLGRLTTAAGGRDHDPLAPFQRLMAKHQDDFERLVQIAQRSETRPWPTTGSN